ncbi:MAG TPA: alpha/beta fold hydrolase [Aggregatilinea sp.]|uniref:alpha/beta hydrolase n=1 Tax=Aggregatilinea sp. TaxID=2806333 RepID=UPI002D04779B|nr:alpha/beta fold hydrolase [Aggregatilinea sp.]HML23672.1 alpha/beta fold hydrolase [Aggregatilinea sp.]
MELVSGGIWLVGIVALVVVGIGYAGTLPLMRRRVPDPPDDPAAYGMAGDDVQFPSRDGTLLGGLWIAASGQARGTVIMCPGQDGSLDKDIPQALPLHDAGFDVLMIDWRAHGRSEGRLVTLGALEQYDLLGALDFLAARGAQRVGILSLSMGAGTTLQVAAYDERIAALVVDGAYPRVTGLLASWLRHHGLPEPLVNPLAWLTLRVGALRARHTIYDANPIATARHVTAPTLFIHGERDPFVSTDDLRVLADAVSGPVEVWAVPDAGHREAYPLHPDDYNARVVAWFEEHLA